MFGIGMSEMVIILAVALLVFGPQKLPEIAKGIAKGLRELRKAGDDLRASVDLDDDARHRPARRPPRPEPAFNDPAAQILGSALTAENAAAESEAARSPAAESAAPDAAAAEPAEPAAPRWPQPAEGTLAQGSLEGAMAPETAEPSGDSRADAPPGEAKGG